MLERNKFEVRNELSVALRHIGKALGVDSDTLKGIVCKHLPQ